MMALPSMTRRMKHFKRHKNAIDQAGELSNSEIFLINQSCISSGECKENFNIVNNSNKKIDCLINKFDYENENESLDDDDDDDEFEDDFDEETIEKSLNTDNQKYNNKKILKRNESYVMNIQNIMKSATSAFSSYYRASLNTKNFNQINDNNKNKYNNLITQKSFKRRRQLKNDFKMFQQTNKKTSSTATHLLNALSLITNSVCQKNLLNNLNNQLSNNLLKKRRNTVKYEGTLKNGDIINSISKRLSTSQILIPTNLNISLSLNQFFQKKKTNQSISTKEFNNSITEEITLKESSTDDTFNSQLEFKININKECNKKLWNDNNNVKIKKLNTLKTANSYPSLNYLINSNKFSNKSLINVNSNLINKQYFSLTNILDENNYYKVDYQNLINLFNEIPYALNCKMSTCNNSNLINENESMLLCVKNISLLLTSSLSLPNNINQIFPLDCNCCFNYHNNIKKLKEFKTTSNNFYLCKECSLKLPNLILQKLSNNFLINNNYYNDITKETTKLKNTSLNCLQNLNLSNTSLNNYAYSLKNILNTFLSVPNLLSSMN